MGSARKFARPLNDALARLVGVRFARVRYGDPIRYHARHEREALEALEILATENSRELSPANRRRADEYAEAVFGGRKYAPWLHVYTAMAGEFRDGWIPDNFFGHVVVPLLNQRLGPLTAIKTLSARVLQSDALPDIAYHVDGSFYARDFSVIDRNALNDIALSAGAHVFVKADRSMQGKDVTRVASRELRDLDFRKIGDCVIQSAVAQHPFFEKIVSEPVATLRITTVRNLQGVVEVRAAFLRLGRRGSERIGDTSVCVSVIDGDGTLDDFGYYHWKRFDRHPDTGASFARARIPEYRAAVDMCRALHARVPHVRIIGWDTTIARDGSVKLFEWNAHHCDIKFSEATVGPCLTGLNWESLRLPDE